MVERPRRCSRGADGIEFVGNVEGRDLPAGAADVVVTDGFTGNVALKLMEGTAQTVAGAIRDAARSNPLAAAGGLLMRPALGGLRRELDPDTTGGAILLGLRGSPSSATAAPAPRGSPTRSGSPPAASRSTRSSAPRRCCASGGATRGALAGRAAEAGP